MERFFSQTNIERYRRMLANPRDEAQRRIILKVLAEEGVKLREGIAQSNASTKPSNTSGFTPNKID
jgi:hypothetical protein